MKFLLILTATISLVACTTSPKTNLTSNEQTKNNEIQEEIISTSEPEAVKKKVAVTRPGLITDKTAGTLTDTLVGLVVDTKIDNIDSKKDRKSAEQLHEAYRKSH